MSASIAVIEPAAGELDGVAASDGSALVAEGRLFEHFLCRVAGLPVRHLEELRVEQTAGALETLLAIEDDLGEDRSESVERFFAVIGGVEDRRLRGRLLRIKRDLHNRRQIRASDLEQVQDLLPPDLAAELRRLRDLGERHGELMVALEDFYRADVEACRRRFQASVRDPDFQKGLWLSSRDLSLGLRRYLRVPVATLGAKERQIERGLMRYLSRTVMKATPFGTFCAITAGRWSGEPADELAFAGNPRRKNSLVRLNKGLYAGLVKGLLGRPAVRDHFGVELNPTLVREGDQWLFLSAADERETFQRVPCSPILDLFRELSESAAGGRSLGELRRAVHSAVDASEDQIVAFTDRLLAIGFLRFRLGIPEQEVRWDRPLRRLLEPIDDPEAAKAVGFLKELRRLCAAFAAAPVEDRDELLAAAGELIRGSYPELLERSAFQHDLPFYEDSGAAASIAVPAASMAPVAADLSDFLRLVSRLSWPRHEHASMRHFYETYYGAGAEPVPLLRFYEDYYREHFKDYLHRERVAEMAPRGGGAGTEGDGFDLLNPFGLEVVERMKAAGRALEGLISARWRRDPTAAEIRLGRADLEHVVDGIPEPVDACRSVSVFGQYLPGSSAGDRPAFVARSFLLGFGKYFSRFLELLPSRVARDLLDGNRAMSAQILAEICGDGGFNGNLHPPLVDREISYPSGESGASEGQLPSAELFVEPTPGDPHSLCLRHAASGRRVTPLDLGFQNPRLRPPLFQLLSSFSPACNFSLRIPNLPGPPGDGVPAVVVRPRITYRGSLILARRQWTVRGNAFPRREAREDDLAYFVRANRWRRRHGIPREVFLRVFAPRPRSEEDGETPAGERPPPRRDHLHKPQYIDFDNPLLVDLFGRAAENLDGFKVELCERLPGRGQLARHGGDRYATELVMQMDFPAAASRRPRQLGQRGAGHGA